MLFITIATIILISMLAIFITANIYALIGGGIIILLLLYTIPVAIKGNFTGTKAIFILLLIGAGVFIIFLPSFNLLQMEAYLAPSSGVLVKEIYGDFECQNTGDYAPAIEINPGPRREKDYIIGCTEHWYEYNIECLDAGTQGCQYKVNPFTCPTTVFCGGSEYQDYYTINNGIFRTPSISNWISMSNGDSMMIRTYCRNPANDEKVKMVEVPQIDFRKPSKKIYVNTYGQSWSGWLAGSEGCKLVSSDLNALDMINAQDKLDKQVYDGQNFPFGVSINYVIGWEEVTSFGNVNPLGQYQNKDVTCKPFLGIYEVEQIETVNNKIYYKEGSQIRSYIEDNTMCCNNNECGTGVCDSYTCTSSQTATCEFGSCSSTKVGNILGTTCREDEGTFNLITQICEEDLCISEEEKEVKCCRDYCDRQYGEDYYCNYDNGCQLVTIQKTCGPGQCCIEGGDYKVQNCPDDKECCLDELIDPFRGVCRTECLPKEAIVDKIAVDTSKEDCLSRNMPGQYRYEWIEEINYPWYKFWKKDKPAYCRDKYVLYYILGGIGIFLLLMTIIITTTSKKSKKKGGKKKQ